MAYVSVCRNIIAANNKRAWQDPEPTIRIANTASGRVTARAHEIGIVDGAGNIVARLVATKDGRPVLKCGAKVALVTEFPVEVLDGR